MNGVSGCVPLRFSMPALLLFIGDYDSSLTKAAICFAFTFLEKYENPAVLVRNVGCLSMAPSSVLRQGLHTTSMRPLARLEYEALSGANHVI